MLVTAMDINMTIINNNAGNGDGYNCDNVLKQYLVTAMDIIVTIINKHTHTHWAFRMLRMLSALINEGGK